MRRDGNRAVAVTCSSVVRRVEVVTGLTYLFRIVSALYSTEVCRLQHANVLLDAAVVKGERLIDVARDELSNEAGG